MPVVTTDISPAVPAPSRRPEDPGVTVAADPAGAARTSRLAALSWAAQGVDRAVVGRPGWWWARPWPWPISWPAVTTSRLPARPGSTQGLLGWDAGWYESIARQGYWGAGHQSLRFFPLFPVLARGLAVLPGVGVGAAVVVVANVSALIGTAVVVGLVRYETGDDRLAGRAAWLVCLAPAAFTFVMGYAEGTLLALAAGVFARAAEPALVVGGRPGPGRRAHPAARGPAVHPRRHRSGPGVAHVGSRRQAVGTAGRRGRSAAGDGGLSGLGGLALRRCPHPAATAGGGRSSRTALADPLVTLAHDASYLVHGHHLGEGLHLPWVVLAVALLVVVFRSWPASYGAFAAAVLVVALTGSNLDSFERYALSAFPLVLAGASLTSSERVFRVVLVLSAAGLLGYALLAFTNLYVPVSRPERDPPRTEAGTGRHGRRPAAAGRRRHRRP